MGLSFVKNPSLDPTSLLCNLQRLNLTIDKSSVSIFVCDIDGPEIPLSLDTAIMAHSDQADRVSVSTSYSGLSGTLP